MKKVIVVKSIFSATAFLIGLTPLGNAHAQALYQPYYYIVREQNQTTAPLQRTPPAPAPNYAPDDRLSPQTNQQLAQGNPPPPTPKPKPWSSSDPI